MVTSETKNATAQPTARIAQSSHVIAIPSATNLTTFKRLAPAMTGIARKNENSAAATRETPSRREPIMVEPERDVPGMSESI